MIRQTNKRMMGVQDLCNLITSHGDNENAVAKENLSNKQVTSITPASNFGIEVHFLYHIVVRINKHYMRRAVHRLLIAI